MQSGEMYQFIQVHLHSLQQAFTCSEERRRMNLDLFSKQSDMQVV